MNSLIKQKSALLLFAIWFLSESAFSIASLPEPFSSIHHHYELFLTVGASAPKLNNTPTVVMNGTVTNTYAVQSQRRWSVVTGTGIARVFSPNHVRITLGPSVYYVDFDRIKGIEHPFSNGGSFDTLNYTFSADSAALFLESHLILSNFNWQPIFILGAGCAWNRLHFYNEVATDPNSSASPATDVFHNNTINSFAYEAGVGIQHRLFSSKKAIYRGSIEYRYFNFGAGKFASSSLQTGNDVLSVKTLHANAILFSLSAAFH